MKNKAAAGINWKQHITNASNGRHLEDLKDEQAALADIEYTNDPKNPTLRLFTDSIDKEQWPVITDGNRRNPAKFTKKHDRFDHTRLTICPGCLNAGRLNGCRQLFPRTGDKEAYRCGRTKQEDIKNPLWDPLYKEHYARNIDVHEKVLDEKKSRQFLLNGLLSVERGNEVDQDIRDEASFDGKEMVKRIKLQVADKETGRANHLDLIRKATAADQPAEEPASEEAPAPEAEGGDEAPAGDEKAEEDDGALGQDGAQPPAKATDTEGVVNLKNGWAQHKTTDQDPGQQAIGSKYYLNVDGRSVWKRPADAAAMDATRRRMAAEPTHRRLPENYDTMSPSEQCLARFHMTRDQRPKSHIVVLEQLLETINGLN